MYKTTYKMKEEKARSLKDGRTFKEIGNTLGMTDVTIGNTFRGTTGSTKILALALISIKENCNIKEAEEKLDNYFAEV